MEGMGALVLVVDDSPSIRAQIKSVLLHVEGFDEFLEAGDGLQAFKLMVDRHPDLVVCDLIMPVFDGLKFLAMRATRADVSHATRHATPAPAHAAALHGLRD